MRMRRSHAVRKEIGNQGNIFLGLLLTTIVVLRLTTAIPGFAFFVVVPTTVPLALLVQLFIAITSRYRVAEDYVDYIDISLAS